ncbi:MAG TPA: pectate lyase [Candidatus Brocadiia bacterium]|nr:pectate lyase [Candidatus Brocadiia bacterium]
MNIRFPFLASLFILSLASCADQIAQSPAATTNPATPAPADIQPSEPAPDAKPQPAPPDLLQEKTVEAILKSSAFMRSISTHGGYLWEYTLDLKKRWGEGTATEMQIWVQPPGTPSVGQALLRAYRATGKPEMLDHARAAGYALAWGQLPVGGWKYSIDFASFDPANPAPPRNAEMKKLAGSAEALRGLYEKLQGGTFDDDTTQSALRFLMDLDKELDEEWLDRAIKDGLEFILKAQYPNGGWPQIFPLCGGYHDYYTFNDSAMNDCIDVMLMANTLYGDDRFLQSARKAGDFIILSQCKPPQTGWAQQYDMNIQPAWARTFEPPAVCSLNASTNIRTLVDLYLYTGESRYLEPIPAAIDWLNRSSLPNGVWARYYEIGTNRPFYCDRDRRIVYNVEELGEERRYGYSWHGEYGVAGAIAYYTRVKEQGRDAYLAERDREPSQERRKSKTESLSPGVNNIIAAMDEQGRWVNKDRIRCADFCRNINALCEYLELSKQP